MDLAPVLASLRRSPLGPLLILLQVALTLAILLNAAGVVHQNVARMRSPSGVDERNVFTLLNRWVGQPADSAAQVVRDLEVVRATPGVLAAISTNGIPLSGRGWSARVDTKPVDPALQGSLTRAQLYYFDEQGVQALGLHVEKGRWFTAGEVRSVGEPGAPSIAILTRALADHLFPGGDAVGKVVYMGTRADTVVGIVENLQVSDPGNPSVPIEVAQYSLIKPSVLTQPILNNYIVRTRPGELGAAMKEVERRLREANPLRVITQFRSFTETRQDAYRGVLAINAMLVTVNLLLVGITALGIAGLASYWVAQRQRMIGVRRALGARRFDILAYFHTENLLIVGSGALLGTGLAVALNTLLLKAGVPRIESVYLWGGVLAVLMIGQLAVLAPALRATRVPPALATRSG